MMQEKINIAELLKDCPKGIEFDCTNYDGIVKFDGFNKNNPYAIRISVMYDGEVEIHSLTKYGQTSVSPYNKCVIFPKGKTTWEGFVPPCRFKDGDIIADNHKNIAIYKGKMWYNCNLADFYCGYRNYDNRFLEKPKKDGHFGLIEELHLATEEEKAKLFQTIKDNGYKWNTETKTLEKLIEPKFKVGDRIRTKKDAPINMANILITKVNECSYDGVIGYTENPAHINFKYQDLYELDPNKLIEPKFKVGDTVQNLDGYKVEIIKVNIDKKYYEYQIIEYLSLVSIGIGIIYFKEQDDWELVQNKFDITTMKPFDKVLVRDNDGQMWTADIFSFYNEKYIYPFICAGHYTDQCIPYEGNERLLGTTDDCDEFYKTWK